LKTISGSIEPSSRLTFLSCAPAAEAICRPIDAGMVDQRHSGRGAAGDHVDHARGQDVEDFGELQRRQRILVRRLADDGVAGGDRRRHLPRHQQQREVERHDRGDHPERLLDREVDLVRRHRRQRQPVARTRHLGVVVEAGGDPLDAVDRFAERFAGLERHQRRQLVLERADAAADFTQQTGLFDARHLPPGMLRGAGGGNGAADVFRPAVGDLAKRRQRGRIGDRAAGRRRRLDPRAVDQNLVHDVRAPPLSSLTLSWNSGRVAGAAAHRTSSSR
jgi:hypothetical protein